MATEPRFGILGISIEARGNPPFSQFVQSFTKLSFAARISGNLKIGLLQFLAELVPHYNLIKYVMDSKQQNHEYLRNKEIYWPDNIDVLNNAITRSEYNKVNLLKYSYEEKCFSLSLQSLFMSL